ncbi:MAG: cell division protein FtsQ/DivIB [bacterium]
MQKRIRRSKRRGRKLRARVLLVILVLGILASAGCGIYRRARDWSAFSIRTIEVRGVSEEQIASVIDVSGVKKGSSILRLNRLEVVNRLKSLDFVRNACVRRRPMGRVVLDILTREPFALVNGRLIVGEDGVEVRTDPKNSDIPEIACSVKKDRNGLKRVDREQLKRAVLILDVLKDLGVRRVSLSESDDVNVLLTDGTVIRLGASGLAKKYAMVDLVLKDLKRSRKKFSLIDARFSSQILVKK